MFECVEMVRESGFCNMMDGRCVAEVADAICDAGPASEIEEAVQVRRGWGSVLLQFSEWKKGGQG
jgi:hypothetical protein